jgi:hypothetical protein
MAHKEIPAITAADPLDGTEQIHVVQGVNSRRTTIDEVGARVLTLVPYIVPFGFSDTPTDGAILLIHAFTEAVTFSDEFAVATSYVGIPPAAEMALTVEQSVGGAPPVTVGSITIDAVGAVTFATTGGEVSFAVGDTMIVTGPSPADGTINQVAISLSGVRGG